MEFIYWIPYTVKRVFMDSINRRLKEAREAGGLTLDELAKQCGYHVSTINNVENGHDRPSKRLRAKLIEVLELNESWLDSGKGGMFNAERMATSKEIGKRMGVLDAHDARKARVDPAADDEIWLKPLVEMLEDATKKIAAAAAASKQLDEAAQSLKTCSESLKAQLYLTTSRKRRAR